MKISGTVKFYDHDKGFGFIARNDGRGLDIYFSAKEVRNSGIGELLCAGDSVACMIVAAGDGRHRAVAIELLVRAPVPARTGPAT